MALILTFAFLGLVIGGSAIMAMVSLKMTENEMKKNEL